MHTLRRSLSIVLPAFLMGLIVGGVGMGIAATIRGSSVFGDVPEGAFFDEAVGEMYSIGVIRGYSNGNFGPNDFVTRGQLAVMLKRLRDDILGSSGSQSSAAQSSSSSSSSVSSASSAASSSSVASSPNGAFRFSNTGFSIPETVSTLTLSVQRAGGTTGDVSVQYTVKGGTALSGDDFVSADHSLLSFRDGEASKTFTVSIKDDKIAEGSETVILELSDPTGGAVLGSPSTATLTILDNEAPSSGGSSSASSQASGAGTLGFSALAYEVLESSATALIAVVRTGGSSGSVGVNYATADKTAHAGTEYTTTNGTLSFASGETSKTFTVPILDDTAVDGKKALTLTLSAPTGGVALGTSSITLNIADDEIGVFGSGSFIFSKSSYQATEGDGIATLTVNRVGGTKNTVSVTYTTAGGSALPGQDYTNTTGVLTFEPGEQSKTFTIPILRDSVNDSNEYFTVTLSSPTGGTTLGDPSSAAVYVYE